MLAENTCHIRWRWLEFFGVIEVGYISSSISRLLLLIQVLAFIDCAIADLHFYFTFACSRSFHYMSITTCFFCVYRVFYISLCFCAIRWGDNRYRSISFIIIALHFSHFVIFSCCIISSQGQIKLFNGGY